MTEPNAGMNFCAGIAPPWAEEIRHPDLHSTEFWRLVCVVHSDDFNEDVVIGVVQNGPGASPQITLAGIRFTPTEGREVADALDFALVMTGEERDVVASSGPVPDHGPDDQALASAG